MIAAMEMEYVIVVEVEEEKVVAAEENCCEGEVRASS